MADPRTAAPTTEAPLQRFELELLGGAVERRFHRARPEIDAMPWGSLDLTRYTEDQILAARRSWTTAAFQEHRTAAACSIALRALIECRAPVDLIAQFARFPLDELVHVELCARMAMELGGGIEILHNPDALCAQPDQALPPLLRAADLVTRFFCVGEAMSIPLLHSLWVRASLPLPRAVLGRIVRDEGAHGTAGWLFLDWALPELEASAEAVLTRAAQETIDGLHMLWDDIRRRPRISPTPIHPLGWMETDEYLADARRSLELRVVRPLRDRGIQVSGERSSSTPGKTPIVFAGAGN